MTALFCSCSRSVVPCVLYAVQGSKAQAQIDRLTAEGKKLRHNLAQTRLQHKNYKKGEELRCSKKVAAAEKRSKDKISQLKEKLSQLKEKLKTMTKKRNASEALAKAQQKRAKKARLLG